MHIVYQIKRLSSFFLFWPQRRLLCFRFLPRVHWWKLMFTDWLWMGHFGRLLLGVWLLGIPTNSRSLDHDLVLEGRQFGIGIRQIKPGDIIFIENLESKDVLSSDWEVLLKMFESDFVFLNVDSEYIRHFRIVLIFRYVVIN